MTDAHLHEPARLTPIVERAQVVVLGGGPAGVAAATAAARAGARTLLIERYGFLGGMGTIARVTSFCGLYGTMDGKRHRVAGGIARRIVDRLDALDGLATPHSILGRTWGQAYDTGVYKEVLDHELVAAGVEAHFHTFAVGVVREGDRIEAVLVESKSGRGAITGDVFIDCSGDADLAFWSGADWEQGSAAGSWAYPTLMFRMGHIDDARALSEGKPNLKALMAEEEARTGEPFPRRSAYINPQPHAGEWRANVTQLAFGDRAVDATNAREMSFGELEGRRQVRRFFEFLKARVPGFENAYLLDVAPQLGIRESRRLRGVRQLTRDDVLGCAAFEDRVGINSWPVEIHGRGNTTWSFLEGRGYHDVPYRCLLPDSRAPANLLVAGRCLSATQDAQAAMRVSGPCFAMGEAAGTAAALVGRGPVAQVDIPTLQRHLLDGGALFEPELDP